MGRPRKKKTPDLLLTLDFGGSGLKCIYQTWENKPEVLFMEPEVIEVSSQILKEKTQNLFHNVNPENMAWIGIEQDYQAVGYFASAQFNAIARLRPKKHSLAVYRTLAAVWVIQQRLELPTSFEIALTVLLPSGEMSDSQMMLKNIKTALSNYETPSGELNVNTTDLNCFPEGTGVYLLHYNNSQELVRRKVLVLIMIGYRNASILLSKRGMVTDSRTIDLGMSKYLDIVIKKTSGLTPEQIIKAIAKAEEEKKRQEKSELHALDFLNLTELHLSIETRKKQAQQILDAINSSKLEYVKRIQQWLSEILPTELDEVVFCGGTVDFFQEELDNLFPATPVKWHGNFTYPEELNEKWLGNRLADAYGLSKLLAQEIKEKYMSGEKVLA